ncbi:M14 family metallopeptidase [Hufsiella ginkgonis]|uniref:Peptidase n=1 Tax=Hufsiella ginkgonis TaxID=2695274 RepID=A0A7K1XZU8_9SPHI|nr:M14 metallopeptidase family protein [Hufsiella ginkgonis]MXV16259.1 peptidase [Hufsiella ginkgonis]
MINKYLSSLAFMLLFITTLASAQNIPSPKEHFGFSIGDDYNLANFTQTEAYFKKLSASDRTKMVDIGLTEEGRHQFMMIISSPENIKNLERYREISKKLARAEGLTDEQARALAAEGKTVVWIDGGLHANETVGAHQLIETAWQLVSRKDPETLRLLNGAIILMVHANPDGQELISNWYMKEKDPLKRSLSQVPRLYQKYIGHDNNRDFYMMNMKESKNINRQLYLEWLPQIVYNHHQAGPAGSVVAGPPYRDPFNFVFDPLLVTSLDAIGAAMNNRVNLEGKPGYTSRSGSTFSTWWNGGLRTTTYFHNMLGLLTEIIGSPTPSEVPLVPDRLEPNSATPNPVTPQVWHYRQSIDYSVSLNYAVIDYAVRYHDEVLFNMYKMAKNSIDRGSRDYWTLSPKRVEEIKVAAREGQPAPAAGAEGAGGPGGFGGRGGMNVKYFDAVLKNPALRDARAYVVPADQADFPTAVKFLNTLIATGVRVHQATAAFTVAGKKYPAGSYIVKTDQAFRPHVLDMFEPQDHPNDFQYPGGPPIRPYDAAGWTLAFQMGVQFDRILDALDGPFTATPYGELLAAPKETVAASAKAGYLLSPKVNNAFIAVNDLLKAGAEVYRVSAAQPGVDAGAFFIPASAVAKTSLLRSAADLGVRANAAAKKPAGAVRVTALRIGLWDTYGGSMPSGWIRWMFEQYHFPFTVIYPQEIDGGNLKDKYDVIVFASGGIPSLRGGRGFGGGGGGAFGGARVEIPAEFQKMTGSITAEKSVPELKKFMEAGGSVVAIGSSSNLAYHLKLPVKDALTETVNGQDRPLPGEKFYIPGSIMQVTLASTDPAEWGMDKVADVVFDSSPVFKLQPGAEAAGIKTLAWYATDKTLRSGWAWGQSYLKDGVAAFEAPIGAGKLYAFGPEITFRAQPHGTFKLLFNQLYGASKAK